MTDKERILMKIIQRIIPGLALSYNENSKSEYITFGGVFSKQVLNSGDLVIAATIIKPNDFMVGFVENVGSDYVVVREIGSKRKVKYYDERFHIINKKPLGYEILEGVQYQTYIKVLKAFNYSVYMSKFKSIRFKDNQCIVQARKLYTNECAFEFSFNYNSKTTIKQIGIVLTNKEKSEI